MKKYFILVLIMFTSLLHGQSGNLNGKRVLIYTRNGEGYVHDNIEASVEALKEICAGMGIKTSVSDDPSVFEKKINKFDAVIFSNTNNEAFLSDLQRENFRKYIQSGHGFMGIHSASGSERNWPWFWSMLGGKFVRHPALQEFEIKVLDQNHPSTEHITDVWKWEDECYFMDHLNPSINVLIAVDLNTVEDDKKDVYPGTVFGELFPLAWYHEFEGGRSWYTAIGHKKEHYADPDYRQHLAGGIVWVLE